MRAQLRSPAPRRIVWDGQSHNWVPGPGQWFPGRSVPVQVMDGSDVPWQIIAINGTSWGTLATTVATRRNPQVRSTGTDVLVMLGGQSDVLQDAQTGAQAYARACSYRDSARVAGFGEVIGCTMPDIGPILGVTPTQHQALLDHNTLMRADSGSWDAVADLYAVLPDALDTDLFQIDQLHLTTAGAALAADVLRPLVLP